MGQLASILVAGSSGAAARFAFEKGGVLWLEGHARGVGHDGDRGDAPAEGPARAQQRSIVNVSMTAPSAS